MISFDQAWQLTLGHMGVLDTEEIALLSAVDRVTAGDLSGLVDSPSADAIVKIREGHSEIGQGQVVEGQLLR